MLQAIPFLCEDGAVGLKIALNGGIRHNAYIKSADELSHRYKLDGL
jgi:hypothetical protein